MVTLTHLLRYANKKGQVAVRIGRVQGAVLLVVMTCGSLAATPAQNAAAASITGVECQWMVRTKHGTANVRSGPGTQYRVVSNLRPGQRLFYRSATANGWYRVYDWK